MVEVPDIFSVEHVPLDIQIRMHAGQRVGCLTPVADPDTAKIAQVCRLASGLGGSVEVGGRVVGRRRHTVDLGQLDDVVSSNIQIDAGLVDHEAVLTLAELGGHSEPEQQGALTLCLIVPLRSWILVWMIDHQTVGRGPERWDERTVGVFGNGDRQSLCEPVVGPWRVRDLDPIEGDHGPPHADPGIVLWILIGDTNHQKLGRRVRHGENTLDAGLADFVERIGAELIDPTHTHVQPRPFGA